MFRLILIAFATLVGVLVSYRYMLLNPDYASEIRVFVITLYFFCLVGVAFAAYLKFKIDQKVLRVGAAITVGLVTTVLVFIVYVCLGTVLFGS